MKNLKTYLGLLLAIAVSFACGFIFDHESVLCASMMVVSPDPIRAAFSRCVETFKSLYNVSDISELGLQQFTCRMLKELSNTNNSYTLDPKSKNATNTDLQTFEQLLPDKINFFIGFIRVGLRKWDATNKFLYPLYSHEDANYFTVTNELKSVYALFNGSIDILTDNSARMVTFLNDNFRRVPGQQYETLASPALPFWPAYGPTLEDKGYHQAAPNLVMDTNKVNQIKVLLKGYQAAIAGGSDFNVLQVDLYGWNFSGLLNSGGNCPIAA